MFDEITSFPNLLMAFQKASLDKRSRHDVMRYRYSLERNIVALRERLLNETWEPGKYRSFTVKDPKERLIQAAPFEDRIVHHRYAT